MDMLYARYSSPMDLVRTYINRGRFGEFVQNFIQADRDRRQAEADKDDEWLLWIAYVHSYSEKSFVDWKADLMGNAKSGRKTGGDYDLDDKGINAIISNLFPNG